ncbi:MAG: GGDEF domain-containing protein [Desulfobacteraceae bacterium]|nr:GGDEF domain-containing protein [Desulfobacteraceae bacterium]
MRKSRNLADVFNNLRGDLRSFITLSLGRNETTWEEWLFHVKKDVKVSCWEMKGCSRRDCPAYENQCRRCWLIAGTMCGGEPVGEFALKYISCSDCNVYQAAVMADPADEVYEHLITLVYSLRDKQLELKSMALQDGLTGLYNRACLDMTIGQEMKKIKRYGGGFTVTMIDIDNFKQINDTYGHLHGDGILREFALILKNSVRESDLIYRYGGDEFIIISPETSDVKIAGMIDRIERGISRWNAEYGSENYILSFSHGSAVYDKEKDFRKVFEEADAQMYTKKQNKKQN